MDPRGQNDFLIWTPSPDGHFSIKDTWNLINTKKFVVPSRKWIWSKLIPPKMLLFL